MGFPISEQDILNRAFDASANAIKVGGAGAVVSLAASAERTASADGTAVSGVGIYRRVVLVLDVTEAATAAGDTLDVYVDVSLDGASWINAVHFDQVLGNGGAKQYYAVLDASNPGTSVIDASADASAGDVRPALFGAYMRARWAVVEADDAAFTFSVVGYAQ